MKTQPILIGILLAAVVGVNYFNNTRPSAEYIVISPDEVMAEAHKSILTRIANSCKYNGSFSIDVHDFMCVKLDNNDFQQRD